MTPPGIELRHAQTTKRLIGLFFDVYHELGHGFLESVYEEAFAVALEESGLKFERQKPLTVWFRGRLVGTFRADAVVEDTVVVELKAARALGPPHEAQLLNYLKATNLTVGLIFNFGPRPKFLRRILEITREKDYRGIRG
jgi:GxxExxY protein